MLVYFYVPFQGFYVIRNCKQCTPVVRLGESGPDRVAGQFGLLSIGSLRGRSPGNGPRCIDFDPSTKRVISPGMTVKSGDNIH